MICWFSTVNRQSEIIGILRKLTHLDWIIVAGYFLTNLFIDLYYCKKASASTNEFFVSGREVSWWLAVTFRVATTFAADPPLRHKDTMKESGDDLQRRSYWIQSWCLRILVVSPFKPNRLGAENPGPLRKPCR